MFKVLQKNTAGSSRARTPSLPWGRDDTKDTYASSSAGRTRGSKVMRAIGTKGATGEGANRNSVQTPKLPPPPRRACALK